MIYLKKNTTINNVQKLLISKLVAILFFNSLNYDSRFGRRNGARGHALDLFFENQ